MVYARLVRRCRPVPDPGEIPRAAAAVGADRAGLRPARRNRSFIAAETAWRMLTQRDPYVNMLRATIATFSAGLGGANAITVLPHTLALGLPDPFARRVARNTQLVLLEESNLAKVSDPAAGSGGIESLTQAAVRSGVGAVSGNRAGRRRVRGARAKPDPAQGRGDAGGARTEHRPPQGSADRRHRISQSARGSRRGAGRKAGRARALRRGRDSNSTRWRRCGWRRPFEALRDRSDQILKGSGARPKVFLANLGTAADFTARATFAKSFFETGGIEAIDTEGFADPAALAAAFKASGAGSGLPVLVRQGLCRPRAPRPQQALQAAGAQAYLSGGPARRAGSRAACRRRRRFHLRRRRCAGDLAGSLSADGASMTAATKPVLTGGCQCGAIRFAVSAPPMKVSICHCRMCQKASGAPFASFADIDRARFRLDPRHAGRIPLLLHRRARFLQRTAARR